MVVYALIPFKLKVEPGEFMTSLVYIVSSWRPGLYNETLSLKPNQPNEKIEVYLIESKNNYM